MPEIEWFTKTCAVMNDDARRADKHAQQIEAQVWKLLKCSPPVRRNRILASYNTRRLSGELSNERRTHLEIVRIM